jgi:demethylmenaquinone methyltransferase / 2-methoxy-6-polyprenyl-1,4-benzoquinol methylase
VYRLTRKGEDIRNMFGAIAPRYDFLNRLLSLGIDRRWRKVAVGMIRCPEGGRVLDVATGTGDVALEIASRSPASVKVTGIDFCREMVDLGRVKVADSPYAGRISLEVAPCEEIPFADDTFDAATIAFGIRNVVDRKQGLAEMHRVLKPGGIMVILEFSTPVTPLFRRLYHWYFLKVLPAVAGFFSQKSAYQYLPDSVLEFPPREAFEGLMAEVGLTNISHRDLTFGIATVYRGEKQAGPL